VIVAASSLGHAVNPSVGARTQLLLRDGPRDDLRRSHIAPSHGTDGSLRQPHRGGIAKGDPSGDLPKSLRPLDVASVRSKECLLSTLGA